MLRTHALDPTSPLVGPHHGHCPEPSERLGLEADQRTVGRLVHGWVGTHGCDEPAAVAVVVLLRD